MSGDYPAGADISSAPWNEREEQGVVFCNGTMYCNLRKNVELEHETKIVVSNGLGYPNVSNEVWEEINHCTNLQADKLISDLARALKKYAQPQTEKEQIEISRLLCEAKGWECYEDFFEVESESCNIY